MAELPLLRRFPALSHLARAAFGAFPTPVERVALPGGRTIHVKRDDRSGGGGRMELGGNKVRALEWLLGMVVAGDNVLTVGPRGSTHALTMAVYARRLGAHPYVVRWRQEMNEAARVVDAKLRAAATVIDAGFVPPAYAMAYCVRVGLDAHWIPAGGTKALGILGHVNAALELAEQIGRGECPAPSEIVVPLGTGGTVAGIALGLRIAGVRAVVRAVRVAPAIIASSARVLRLAAKTATLIERMTGTAVPRVDAARVVVDHDFYAGGYGRPTERVAEESALAALGVRLDDTYSRKAFAAAVRKPSDATLFWLTFDGRLLEEGGRSEEARR